MDNPDNLPLWMSHKIVAAAMIGKVTLPEGHYRLAPLTLEFDDGTTRNLLVTIDYIEKHKPQAGGYFVRYDDGYASFSPAAAFEAGYTLQAAVPQVDGTVDIVGLMKRPKVWEVVADEPAYPASVVLMLMAEVREEAARLAERDIVLLRRNGHKAVADAYSMAAHRIRSIKTEELMSKVMGAAQ